MNDNFFFLTYYSNQLISLARYFDPRTQLYPLGRRVLGFEPDTADKQIIRFTRRKIRNRSVHC